MFQRFQCDVCRIPGLLQIVSKGYSGVRHYSHLDPMTKKPRFTYHRLSLEYVKGMLDTDGNPDRTGQDIHDLKLLNQASSLKKAVPR